MNGTGQLQSHVYIMDTEKKTVETGARSLRLHVATYNIHKGFSQFNRRMMVRELRERLQLIAADIIFLQEVQGEHHHHDLRSGRAT